MHYYKKHLKFFEKFSSAPFYFALSLFILILAQPDFSLTCTLLASSVGYAFAFKALSSFSSLKRRFWAATLMFAVVQAVHISWFTADEYVGLYIYPFLGILLFGLGIQFGLFSILLLPSQQMNYLRILALASLWALLEWSRLFILSGYPFDPVGLTLSATLYGMQFVSLVGIFGLSFWVFLTNLLFYKRSYKVFLVALLLPYLFGGGVISYHDHRKKEAGENHYSVLLVQTGLKPEQKISFQSKTPPLSLQEQWEHILSLLVPFQNEKVDMILFSEAQVPYGTLRKLYYRQEVEKSFCAHFGEKSRLATSVEEKVGNGFWAQSLADTFDADVIIGFEDGERDVDSGRLQVVNAAFVYTPFGVKKNRYEKRVLVPMGEYIPFEWCKKILSKYGIVDSYKKGKKAEVFCTDHARYGISICYEEAFGHLMRENRLLQANVLVNLTNDVWYPRSRLPYVHFLHGRLRAVEAGVPLLRSCNSGVTCGVDSLGRIVAALPYESPTQPLTASSCLLEIPTYSYPTLYTYVGDYFIVTLSLFFLILFVFTYSFQKQLYLHKKGRRR